MADISKIVLPSGSEYDIKDAGARALIAELQQYTEYLGVTSTALADGDTTNPIVIDGGEVTAKKGNVVNYGSKEFIFNGSAWQEFGDLSGLGALAFEDEATGSYTPAGQVAAPVFTGDEMTATGSVTADGTVAAPVFTGTAGSVSVKGTPAGDISAQTFTGDTMTSTGNFTPAGNITMGVDAEGTANYTPAGSVAAPVISVDQAGATATVNSITDVGTLPSATMPVLDTTVANETLTLSWTEGSFSAGTLPTKGADQVVKTGDASYTASAPAFSGTAVSLKGTFAGTQATVSVSGTPEGSVSQATFSGSELTATGSFTPEGTNSAPAFTGSAVNVSVKGTPTGTNSAPAFTGTAATITVGPAD